MKNLLKRGGALLLAAGLGCGLGCRSSSAPQPIAVDRSKVEIYQGGITRGDKNRKAIALAFTGHGYAEGGETILNELQKHHAKASFFCTGKFVANPDFAPLLQRLAADGHYFSVHSDQHLLYCSWDKERQLQVSRDEFRADLQANFARYDALKLKARPGRLFIPPFEHYNQQIVDWANELSCVVINYTPGTRSNADYTGEADKNFVPSQTIFDSIMKREQSDSHGLNGFILLLHIGSGPGRADKFHHRFGELLDHLTVKGYEFVRVDELLAPSK
ncbi:MAG: polysaccharide deacetylase family protein [Verrucomicrobiota bacterium]